MKITPGPAIISLLIGYLFGCIQTAYLLGKLFGKIDIRRHGSGNAGASNVTAMMGMKFGAITALIDILKGTAAVLAVKAIYPGQPEPAYIAGIGAILGHIFPFYMNFHGGKGVAALVGMMFGFDWRLGVFFVLLVAIPAVLTDYIVSGSFTTYIALPIVTLLYGYHWIYLVIAISMTVLCFYKHRANIRRIIDKTETKISSVIPYRKAK